MDTSTAPSVPDSTLYRVGHRVFIIGLILKGLNAAAELVGGALLLLLPFATIQQIVHVVPLHIFRDGLTEKLVNFAAWYFLSHGALKAVVIGCLVWGKTWAYPLGIVIFVGFGIYQTWEYFHSGGALYLILDVLDAALIGLTIMEWRHALKKRVP